MPTTPKNKEPKNIFHCVQDNPSALKTIFAKAQELNRLQTAVKLHLPAHLRDYCQIANKIGSRLVLMVASGAIATDLRFQMQSILTSFKQEPALRTIEGIDIKVRPFQGQPQSLSTPLPATKIAPPSPQSADTIAAIAETINDPALKSIMQKIAGRGRRKE